MIPSNLFSPFAINSSQLRKITLIPLQLIKHSKSGHIRPVIKKY